MEEEREGGREGESGVGGIDVTGRRWGKRGRPGIYVSSNTTLNRSLLWKFP